MKNKHGLNTIEAIGICLHIGDNYPNYIKKVLKYNSEIFNKIYLVGSRYGNSPENIEFIDPSLVLKYWESFNDHTPDPTANQLADLLAYDGIGFLESLGKTHISVMKFDTDFVVFNKMLIWRLFDMWGDRPFCSYEDNVYPNFQNNSPNKFINAAFTYQTSGDEGRRISNILRTAMFEEIHKFPGKYTASGPSMLNKLPQDIKDYLIGNIPSNEYIKNFRSPNTIVSIDEWIIGIHLEASVYMFTCLNGPITDFDFEIKDNKLEVKYC